MADCTLEDLQLLQGTLDSDVNHPVWCRYIGLLVKREFTHEVTGDASYAGLGGWSPAKHFNFMWRLTREDLIQVGFDMKSINLNTAEPDGTSDGLHINILEFVTIIIDLWFELSPGFVMQLVLIDLLSAIYLDLPWVSLSPALFPQSSQEIT
jgi:hypothetical protein